MDEATYSIYVKTILENELDAIKNRGLTFLKTRYILITEIYRLGTWDPNDDTKSTVENGFLMFQLSRDFELNGLPSLVGFRSQLMRELREISNFHQPPIPITYHFIRRVITRLDVAITILQENKTSSSRIPPGRGDGLKPLPRDSYGYGMYMIYCIDQAIGAEIARDPSGISVINVLRLLENNTDIVFDDPTRRLVNQRCIEAEPLLPSYRAPAELTRRRSSL